MNDTVPLLHDRFPSLSSVADFDSIIQKCLAKTKTARFSDVGQLSSALEELYGQLTDSAPLNVAAVRSPAKTNSMRAIWLGLSLVVLLVTTLIMSDPVNLAALLCLPTANMKYKDAVRYEIKLAANLEKGALLTHAAESLWQSASTLASKADDRLMLSYIVANLATMEIARGDRGASSRHAFLSLELLCKPGLLPVPQDRSDRYLYKESIEKSCTVLKSSRAGWTNQLDKLADKMNEPDGPGDHYPEAILPLNFLKTEILDTPDHVGMGWAFLRIGSTYMAMKKYDEAIKYTKLAVENYRQANDGEAFGMENLSRRYLMAYTAVPSNKSYYEGGMAACVAAKELYAELAKSKDDEIRKDALSYLPQIEANEERFRQVNERFKKTELRP
jgi:tetratricopeptide (TPR) repeat protein